MITEVKTNISYGYLPLIGEFARANDLVLKYEPMGLPGQEKLKILYDAESDTAFSITFMSVRHLGFENMLCDYLIRCGVAQSLIPYGREALKRDMKKLDEEWEKYRREQLGFR